MDTLKNGVALIVAILILAAAGVLIAYLLGKVGDAQWDHYVYLLSGVEAVAFAAAGWLFGKEVHREQAQTAEQGRKDAENAKSDAIAAAADEHRRGVETARNAVLALDNSAAAAAAGEGTSEMVRAKDAVRAIARSTYPNELSTL